MKNRTISIRIFNIIVKLCILFILCWMLYKQGFSNNRLSDLWLAFKDRLSGDVILWFLFLIALVPINWGLEAQKWQKLASTLYPISFQESFKSVMMGVALGFFTPNRVGEIGGRLIVLPPKKRWAGTGLGIIASAGQLLVSIMFGIAGLLWIIFHRKMVSFEAWWLLLVFGALMSFACIIFYFKIPKISIKGRLFRLLKNRLDQDSVGSSHEPVDFRLLTLNIVYSMGRYITYTIQYIVILNLFGIQIPFLQAFAAINAIFLVQTLLPAPALIELGVRNNAAMFFLGYLSVNKVGIISAASGLWLINIVVPAILGTVYLTKIKILKSQLI